MMKNLLFVIFLTICAIFLTACWDHVEINSMRIVAGVGLDLSEENEGFYHATVEIINVEAGDGEDVQSDIVEGHGPTIYSAVQNAMAATGGKMFANHCKVIVVGEELARRGVNDVVDVVLRNIGFRKTVDVMVAMESTAREIIMSGKGGNEENEKGNVSSGGEVISFRISRVLHSNAKAQYNTGPVSVYKLHESFISNHPNALLPVVYLTEEADEQMVIVEGGAVFYGDRLQGFLSGDQYKLYKILTAHVENGYLLAYNEAVSENFIGARLEKTSAEFTPHIEDGKPSGTVEVKARVVLEGPMLLDVDLNDPWTMQQLHDSLAEQLSHDLKELITHVQQEYGVDIFDFQREFANKYRQEWPAMTEDWRSGFRDMEVEVISDITITGSGLISNYTPAPGTQRRGDALP